MEVQATDRVNLTDPTPAVHEWEVVDRPQEPRKEPTYERTLVEFDMPTTLHSASHLKRPAERALSPARGRPPRRTAREIRLPAHDRTTGKWEFKVRDASGRPLPKGTYSMGIQAQTETTVQLSKETWVDFVIAD